MEVQLRRSTLHLPDDPCATELADLAEVLGKQARADADRLGVQASDMLVMIAESAATLLTASIRALEATKPEPGPAARALAATYERYADELAEIEAPRSADDR